jgi:hypothetical protein
MPNITVSMAEIHAVYGGKKTIQRPAGPTPTYAKASFSTREAHHPGFPPQSQSKRPKPGSR